MGYFKIIEPEETTNLILDPSAEASDPDTSWTIAGDGTTPDVTRVTTDCWIGTGAFSFDIDDGAYTTLKQATTVTATSYTLSAYVKRAAAGVVSATQCRAHFDSADADWDSITAVNDNWYYCIKTATPTAGSRDFGIVGKEAGLLVDAIQLENKAYPTTYCDGSLVGNRTDGYEWNGTANASTSTRHAQERTGGRVRDIEDDLGVLQVNAFAGWGMIEPDHQLINYALSPGGAYQNTKYPARLMDLALTFSGTSLGDMHTDRQALIDAIKLDRTFPKQPFVFRYVVDDTTLEINALYAGGLPGSNPAKFIERGAMRLLCPDPYWQSPNEHVKQLSASTSITVNYLIRTTGDGEWEVLGTGTDGVVYAVHENATDIYIGGTFTTAGGVTVNNVARWDKAGESWYPLDSSMPGVDHSTATPAVYALDEDSTGLIYIGGLFDTAGGATSETFCSYSPGGDTFGTIGAAGITASTEGDPTVYAIVIDNSDNVYVGGNIDIEGMNMVGRVARWDGSSWYTVGTYPNDGLYDGICYALALDGDTIYIGGSFSAMGGAGKSPFTTGIGTYSISGNSFSALGTAGVKSTVLSIAVTDAGVVYLGGYNDNAISGASASAVDMTGAVKWDGTSFTDLEIDATASKYIYALGWESDNQRLYLGGNFTEIDGDTDKDIIAYLEDGTYQDLEVDLKSIAGTIRAISIYEDSAIFGFTGTGAMDLPALTTVTYNGKSETFPILTITGPGSVTSITNITTGSKLSFSGLTLASGETMQVELTPGRRRIYSNVRASLFRYIAGSSDWAEFNLLPGDNIISVQIAATPYARWRNRYESADGVG